MILVWKIILNTGRKGLCHKFVPPINMEEVLFIVYSFQLEMILFSFWTSWEEKNTLFLWLLEKISQIQGRSEVFSNSREFPNTVFALKCKARQSICRDTAESSGWQHSISVMASSSSLLLFPQIPSAQLFFTLPALQTCLEILVKEVVGEKICKGKTISKEKAKHLSHHLSPTHAFLSCACQLRT